MQELARRGKSTAGEIVDVPDVEELYKADRAHRNPVGRAQDIFRFAVLLGFAAVDGSRYELTPIGHQYTAAVDPNDPWSVQPEQAALLRERVRSDDDGLPHDARLALAVQHDLTSRGRIVSSEEFGRRLAQVAGVGSWRESRTFESQGARYRALLEESGLITTSGELTPEGLAVVPESVPSSDMVVVPTVWWVNQGSTFGAERADGFLWAPMLNKAGRPQGHWDAMDEVAAGDVILHYSGGFIRSTSVAQGPSRRAANPLDTDAWENNGRIVYTQYRDLNEPIPLASIPEELRAGRGGPFTRVGSVQQGYLFRLDDKLAAEIAEHFPELQESLPGMATDDTDAVSAKEVEPSNLFADFSGAVEASRLTFAATDGTLVSAFLAGVLAKPFAILTGLSGSGKTQLAMRLGEWCGHDREGYPRHLVVPVRPDWTGPEGVFGYEDVLGSSSAGRPMWSVPEPLEFILRAAADSMHPYILILDEMNLAHVERYFADFLSGLESRKPLLPDLARDDVAGGWGVRSAEKLPLPRNLVVVGTVNVDETTYMFSPKVLDRASTFEFRVDADALDPDRSRPVSAPPASDELLRAFCDLIENDDWHRLYPHPAQATIVDALRQLHGILAAADLEFGHRTFYESLRFAAFYAISGDVDADRVLDLIVMQRLLPKVHGSRRLIEPLLTDLLGFAAGGEKLRLPTVTRKVKRMLSAVRANQFVSFTG